MRARDARVRAESVTAAPRADAPPRRALRRRSAHVHTLDPRSRTVTLNNSPVALTAKEFDLLWFLARHPRQVFSRTQLLDNVWGYEFYGDESTVTVHIRRLREKIERDPANPVYLKTVWGVGYKFEPNLK